MKLTSSYILAALLMAPVAVLAQNVDVDTVVDQFSSGSRSDQVNGSAYAAPTYADITGTINYYTTFESNSAAETPVLDVTQQQSLDGVLAIPGVTGNGSDSFSTSPNFAVYVGDGGGGQNLVFAQETTANYYIRAAAWCEPRTVAGTPPQFERTYIAARVPSLVGTTFNGSSNVDAIGGYGLYFESDTGTFLAVKIHPDRVASDLTGSQANLKDATARTVFAESAPLTTGGWHILEINCYDDLITFSVDGVELAEVTDTKYPAGQAALSYREVFTSNQNEQQGRFDYVQAGPAVAPPAPLSAGSWEIYE